MSRINKWLVALILVFGSSAAFALETPTPPGASSGGPTCKSARVFERILSDLCWECIFPIKVAGVPVGGGSMPLGAVKSPICMCTPPLPGITMGAWFPARITEAVKMPGCSPTFGGVKLPLGSETELGGYNSSGEEKGLGNRDFRHNHYFAFPVGEMLGLVSGCNPLDSFDLLYVTELIPTWSDDLLSFFVNPETAIFANPAALLACSIEAATTGVAGLEPNEGLYWCAGSWGPIYPLTGSVTHESSPPADTSLMATKMMAQLHRWGLARKTMGNSCGGDIATMIPKSQYRMQQYWPSATAILPGGGVPGMGQAANKNHWIGESDFRWGVHKNVPGFEDYLHVIFRWNDCCLEL